jgi:transcriptional regulator with PAS, ATPase and Fis domain
MPTNISKILTHIDAELFYAFIDNPYECPIVIDNKGIIRFMSRYNEKAYGVTSNDAVGRHINEVVKGSHLCDVLKTGKAEIGKVFYTGGRKRIIARIPLKDSKGHVLGAVTKLMFHQTEKITELYHRMEILEEHLKYYQTEIASLKGDAYGLERIIGESLPMQETKKLTLQAAGSDASVMITGESGTGKELFAEAVHQKSQRAAGPFIKVNCAAIPHELIESELFGYEGGSFTGAREQGKPGKFELANGGTIFLDEIGDMPLQMQAKLLRVLQEHEIERVGGTKPLKLDFRVIAATNRNLEDMIQKGTLRKDLFYRLNTFHIHAPCLREIVEDIPRIAYYYLTQLRKKQHGVARRISSEAMTLLKRYSWPGNVRELRNVIERSMNIEEGNQITIDDLPNRIREFYRERYHTAGDTGLLRDILLDAEKRALVEALRMASGNRVKAARMLGIHRTGLYQKIKRYQLNV